MMRSQSASVMSSVGTRLRRARRRRRRMSTSPNSRRHASRTALERRRVGDVSRPRAASAVRALRSRPRPRSTRSSRRPVATTSAPASARPSASARPMPLVPPTTTAVRPDRSNSDPLISAKPSGRFRGRRPARGDRPAAVGRRRVATGSSVGSCDWYVARLQQVLVHRWRRAASASRRRIAW